MSIVVKEYTSKKTGKKSTKYYASVYSPISMQMIWGKGRDKRAEAVKDEAGLLEDVEKGTPKTKGSMKFKDVANLWFASMENTYAESTYKGYKGYYNSKLKPKFDDMVINKITPTKAQEFKNELSKKFKPATVNKTMDLLSMMFDFAIKPLRLIKYNPCDDIKRDKVTLTVNTTWDEKTIGYFLTLDEVKASDYYEMFILSFTTGLRPGEVCGVSTESLQDNNMLSLSRGYNKYGNITDMKTPGSHRALMLDSFVYELLINKLDKKNNQKEEFYNKIKEDVKKGKPLGEVTYYDNDFLFTYPDGTPITPNSYSRAFRNIINSHNKRLKKIETDKGKIPHSEYYLTVIRLYDGRHSFATNNILSGENAKTVSEVMGSKVETVMRNYVHINKATHQATLSKYSSKIFNLNEVKKRKNAKP
jgi:integrase